MNDLEKIARSLESADNPCAVHPLDTMVQSLNEALEQDPGAIHAMLCNRTPCNALLAAHAVLFASPNVPTGGFSMSAFDLLNSLSDVAYGQIIQAVYDKDCRLVKFEAVITPQG